MKGRLMSVDMVLLSSHLAFSEACGQTEGQRLNITADRLKDYWDWPERMGICPKIASCNTIGVT
jgi:hypothetical protein